MSTIERIDNGTASRTGQGEVDADDEPFLDSYSNDGGTGNNATCDDPARGDTSKALCEDEVESTSGILGEGSHLKSTGSYNNEASFYQSAGEEEEEEPTSDCGDGNQMGASDLLDDADVADSNFVVEPTSLVDSELGDEEMSRFGSQREGSTDDKIDDHLVHSDDAKPVLASSDRKDIHVVGPKSDVEMSPRPANAPTTPTHQVSAEDNRAPSLHVMKSGGADDSLTASAASTHEFTDDSDLARPDRKIWIVTTAAMPWRTGTAVNPLLRALYLAKGRPKDSVTLLVPWLDDGRDPAAARAHQAKLYGQVFTNPAEQEEWIREYCRTRCGCDPNEEALLRIRFWKGVYHDGFGSIFPSEDICAIIPDNEADVAILEEPEHLNWFRVPKAAADEVRTAASRVANKARSISPLPRKQQLDAAAPDKDQPVAPSTEAQQPPSKRLQLGWKAKFRHVVGVLHTNYAAYIRQYGMGTSLLTAPALNALSSLVVRAYCHRVIRLSNCLPSFDAAKEVTENIHGVRSEFFVSAPSSKPNGKAVTGAAPDVAPVYFIGKLIWAKGFDRILELQQAYREATGSYFAMDVYGGGNDDKAIRRAFFGRHGSRKHIVQPEDGAALDETHDIAAEDALVDDSSSDKRVSEVFTRSHSLRKQLVEDRRPDHLESDDVVATADADAAVELVFAGGESIRAHVVLEDQASDVTASSLMTGSYADEAASAGSAPVIVPSDVDDDGTSRDAIEVAIEPPASHPDAAPPTRQEASLFHILGDLSGKTVSTGVETAEAGLQLMENVVQSLFGGRNKDLNYDHLDCSSSNSSTSGDSEAEDSKEPIAVSAGDSKTKEAKPDPFSTISATVDAVKGTARTKSRRPNPFGFVPPRARFKWRRHPLPARFLGVQDHIVVRDLEKQTVFLNMSTTEVLCTTTAEALAMGKFVVIPKHPSNEFFYDFPNCLAYEDLEECVEKMSYALSHAPHPLSSSDAHKLSWEGATERLYRAARVSVAEAEEYKQKYEGEDEKAARLHIEGTTHSQNLRNFLNDKLLFDL